jgi:hypothetical protein
MAAKTHKRLERLLMSRADAQDPRNLIKLFEQIKGRKATPEEIAEFERKSAVAKDARSRRSTY